MSEEFEGIVSDQERSGEKPSLRHRYKGMLRSEERQGSLIIPKCRYTDGAGAVCGLGQYTSLHYSDDDHPYMTPPAEGEGEGACVWELQAAGAFGACSRGRSHVVHRRAEESIAEAMASAHVTPPDEVTAHLPRIGHGNFERAFQLLGVPNPMNPEESLAHDFLNDAEVGFGPWPVRQWRLDVIMSTEMRVEVESEWRALVFGLWEAGLAYDQYVWWVGAEARMVRVVWGAALGMTQEEIAERLRGGEWSG